MSREVAEMTIAQCDDCERLYGDQHGFPDLVVPNHVWAQISPTGDDGGLLCPSCICKRLHDKGIKCEGAFFSGPIQSVSYVEMCNLRRIENLEEAMEGKRNHWGAALDDRIAEGGIARKP